MMKIATLNIKYFFPHPFRSPINELPIAESRPAPDSVPRQQSDITSNDELLLKDIVMKTIPYCGLLLRRCEFQTDHNMELF